MGMNDVQSFHFKQGFLLVTCYNTSSMTAMIPNCLFIEMLPVPRTVQKNIVSAKNMCGTNEIVD